MANGARRVGKIVAWPVRRFFNPRFEGIDGRVQASLDEVMTARLEIVRVEHAVNQVKDLVHHDMQASTETAKTIGTTLSELVGEMDEIRNAFSRRDYLHELVGGSAEAVDEPLADVLNYASAPTGFAAQRSLYFNPPVWIAFRAGTALLGGVNERIAEIPYAFRALSGLGPDASILDVGSSESTFCLSLASLGYRVIGIDPRPHSLSHPRLCTIVAAIEEWETDERFDAVACISTIEHLGIGAYGLASGDDVDVRAMRKLHQLTKSGGLLVLTTPFGVASIDELQRTYDRVGLDRLLEGWSVQDFTVLRRLDDFTWDVAPSDYSPVAGDDCVAMVTARRVD
jgi:2-polyprenyl-3-methyl-5-hydroxy-6-metoxy-1,4-benzoquinol methylase